MVQMRLGHARAAALGAVALCFLMLKGFAPGLFAGIDNRTGDVYWRLTASGEERRVVIVDIDETSLARQGAWPWSRDRMAELVRRLGQLGAGPVVFDIVFPDPKPGDEHLAAELKRQPSVLAEIFSLRPGATTTTGRLQGALASPGCARPIAEADGYIGNAPSLVGMAGHITPRIDQDGAVRSLPALICYEGRVYPALGLAALLGAANAAPTFQLTPGANALDPAWRLSHAALPGIDIPLAENGDVRLSYALPRQAFISVSASDVLEGRAPPHIFKGAWVLVGATAFGMGDAVPTPHGGAVGGVEVHAQFISALLDGRLPYTPRAASVIAFLLGGAGLLLLLAMVVAAHRRSANSALATRRTRLPIWGLPLVAGLMTLLLLTLHLVLLQTRQLWLGWAEPATLIMLAGLFLAAVEHAHTRFERERLYGNLSAYLPAPVARQIAFDELSGAIQAERREITVLFADIRNFSAYCEGRPPEESAALLHAFFTVAARIVEQHGGVIEEFIGDAIMVVWNGHDQAERQAVDYPISALAAARGIVEECDKLFPDPPPPGLEPLAVGVGLECGDALVGSFGPIGRRTHAAMGETVTVAARLTAMTGDLAEPILVGEKAAARVAAAESLTSLGEFLLEGLRRPRRIHTPAAARAPKSLTLVRSVSGA